MSSILLKVRTKISCSEFSRISKIKWNELSPDDKYIDIDSGIVKYLLSEGDKIYRDVGSLLQKRSGISGKDIIGRVNNNFSKNKNL